MDNHLAIDPINLEQASRYLQILASDEPVTLMTFDESAKKQPQLTKVLHGTLGKYTPVLRRLNELGAGVFVMVNQGDLKGRKTENVTKVRAVFLDLDGGPLAPVTAAEIPPQMIVESSPGRYHAYWLVEDCDLDTFTPLQKAIATRFGGDPKVCDLPRVMRIPGFHHKKGKPFLTKIIEINDRPSYGLDELVGGLKLQVIREGSRNDALAKVAGSLRGSGMERDAIEDQLQTINQSRCTPPLPAAEVSAVASSIAKYLPNKPAPASNQVFDYPAFLLPANDILSKEEYMLMGSDELGLLLRLWCHCWVNDSAPNDPGKIATLFRLPAPDIERLLTSQVLSQFDEDEDGRLYCGFLREQRDREMDKRGRLAANGRRGGRTTQLKNRNSSKASSVA